MDEPRQCPCCSGARYAECCRPFHRDGVEPPTALVLMRSRYAAFALKQVDYLIRTLHPSHPDLRQPREDLRRTLKRTCNRLRYPGLRIVGTEGPDASGAAYVTFAADVRDGTRAVGFTERSRFLQDGGAWRYVDGEMQPGAQ